MKELCPRMQEESFKNPSNILEEQTAVLIKLCKQLVECGSEPYYSCRDCLVTVGRKPIVNRQP